MIPASLRPYAIYGCFMSLLLMVAVFRDNQADRAYNYATYGWQDSFSIIYIGMVGLVLLALYGIRLTVTYLIGRFWWRHGKDRLAQSIWKGALYGSYIPEAILLAIGLQGLFVTANSCGGGPFSGCGWILLPLSVAYIASIVLQALGMSVGFVAGWFHRGAQA